MRENRYRQLPRYFTRAAIERLTVDKKFCVCVCVLLAVGMTSLTLRGDGAGLGAGRTGPGRDPSSLSMTRVGHGAVADARIARAVRAGVTERMPR